MKTIDKDDLLGYLQVLNYAPVNHRLSFGEQRIGIQTLTGCLARIIEALDEIEYQEKYYGHPHQHQQELILKQAICLREHFNARLLLDNHDPILVNATAMCAELIYSYIRKREESVVNTDLFMQKWDEEFGKILQIEKKPNPVVIEPKSEDKWAQYNREYSESIGESIGKYYSPYKVTWEDIDEMSDEEYRRYRQDKYKYNWYGDDFNYDES